MKEKILNSGLIRGEKGPAHLIFFAGIVILLLSTIVYFVINPNLELHEYSFQIDLRGESEVRQPLVEIFSDDTVILTFFVTNNKTRRIDVIVPKELKLIDYKLTSYNEPLKNNEFEFSNKTDSKTRIYFSDFKKPLTGKIELIFSGTIEPNGRFIFVIIPLSNETEEHRIAGQLSEGQEIFKIHL